MKDCKIPSWVKAAAATAALSYLLYKFDEFMCDEPSSKNKGDVFFFLTACFCSFALGVLVMMQ